MAKVKSSVARPRRKMVWTNEEVRRWSALLAEMVSWPGVRVKHMFGFLSYYCGNVLFAILPRTRSFDSDRLLILKFVPMPAKLLERAQSDPRLGTETRNPGVAGSPSNLAPRRISAMRCGGCNKQLPAQANRGRAKELIGPRLFATKIPRHAISWSGA